MLKVPQFSTRFGDCSFSVAGFTAWNSLLPNMQNMWQIKTYLLNKNITAVGFLTLVQSPFLWPWHYTNHGFLPNQKICMNMQS